MKFNIVPKISTICLSIYVPFSSLLHLRKTKKSNNLMKFSDIVISVKVFLAVVDSKLLKQ